MADSDVAVKVAIFDLNGTLYNKSSKDEFYKFLCKKKPGRMRYYAQMLYYKILLKLHQIRKTEFKENFFNYLDNIPPHQVEKYARQFWEQEYPENFNLELRDRLDELKQNGVQIFCATGGLELYVKPLFEMYKIDGLFGTIVRYEDNTYKVVGLACKDKEKLNRLAKYFNGKPYQIIEAYSDSKEDILNSADKAFLITNGEAAPFCE